MPVGGCGRNFGNSVPVSGFGVDFLATLCLSADSVLNISTGCTCQRLYCSLLKQPCLRASGFSMILRKRFFLRVRDMVFSHLGCGKAMRVIGTQYNAVAVSGYNFCLITQWFGGKLLIVRG